MSLMKQEKIHLKKLKTREKGSGVVILTSDKIDFKTRSMNRDKEDHFIVIKRLKKHEKSQYIYTQ